MADSQLLSTLKDLVFEKMPTRCLKVSNMQVVDQNYIMSYLEEKAAMLSTTVLDAIALEKLGNKQQEKMFERARKCLIKAIANDLTAYAILSHAWDGANEVQFTHLEDEDGLYYVPDNAPGYDKLHNFCETAKSDFEVEFGWMDTVCIDKATHGELVASICNMYQWYANASICIAFLSKSLALSEVSHDPWFTRGWTLQELLAPKRVAFYDQNWGQLGSYNKRTEKLADFEANAICLKIQTTTGILPNQLYNFSPGVGQLGVATRMSWIAKRVTTREEDMAYSVMGIFGVQFDADYNEGREAAFCRLLQAISNTHTRDIDLWILNYAGKSNSSDKVSCSRILPSGPECYDKHLPIVNSTLNDFHRKRFKIIEDGVDVKLLLILAVPVRLNDNSFTLYCLQNSARLRSTAKDPELTETANRLKSKQIIWDNSKENPIVVNIYNDVQSSSRPKPEGSNCFVFGVWNFEDHENHVVFPHVCAAFVFHSVETLDTHGIAVWELNSKHINSGTKLETKDVVTLKTYNGAKRVLLKQSLPLYGLHYKNFVI